MERRTSCCLRANRTLTSIPMRQRQKEAKVKYGEEVRVLAGGVICWWVRLLRTVLSSAKVRTQGSLLQAICGKSLLCSDAQEPRIQVKEIDHYLGSQPIRTIGHLTWVRWPISCHQPKMCHFKDVLKKENSLLHFLVVAGSTLMTNMPTILWSLKGWSLVAVASPGPLFRGFF